MRLNQVTVAVTDYDEAVSFYRALGLRQIVDAPPRYARFETPSGETFSIHVADESGGGTIVYFEVEDVDAFVNGLTLPLSAPPEDKPWLWREARLRDPSGNEICIYRAGDNRRYPPWRLKDEE